MTTSRREILKAIPAAAVVAGIAVLGVVLMVGGLGYVTHFVATLLLPGYPDMAVVRWIRLPAGLGEMGIAGWMAVRGPRRPPS